MAPGDAGALPPAPTARSVDPGVGRPREKPFRYESLRCEPGLQLRARARHGPHVSPAPPSRKLGTTEGAPSRAPNGSRDDARHRPAQRAPRLHAKRPTPIGHRILPGRYRRGMSARRHLHDHLRPPVHGRGADARARPRTCTARAGSSMRWTCKRDGAHAGAVGDLSANVPAVSTATPTTSCGKCRLATAPRPAKGGGAWW